MKENNSPKVKDDFIILDHITKKYQFDGEEFEVLRDTSITIREGEFIIVMGPSGCGKTTLLNLIGALDRTYCGEISIDGQIITSMSTENLTTYRRHKVGFVFQFFNLLPTLTVEENIKAGIEILPISRDEINKRTMIFLNEMNLAHKIHKFPSQLSGGEQQRVSIARALAKNPRLILADEPTGNLDEKNSERIMDLLKYINRKQNITIVLVTHNIAFRKYADRIFEIHDKRLVDKSNQVNLKAQFIERIQKPGVRIQL